MLVSCSYRSHEFFKDNLIFVSCCSLLMVSPVAYLGTTGNAVLAYEVNSIVIHK